MKSVATERMDAAMRSIGFSRKKTRWLGGSSDLPVLVREELAKVNGNAVGVSVLFGGPGMDPEESVCLQLSQRMSCGFRDHYYDVSKARETSELERHFMEFTVPLLERYRTARDLAAGLIAGDVPPSFPGRGRVGLVKDLIDIANAHHLEDVKQRALTIARALDASDHTRSAVRELAEFNPEVAEVVGRINPAPQKRWWQR